MTRSKADPFPETRAIVVLICLLPFVPAQGLRPEAWWTRLPAVTEGAVTQLAAARVLVCVDEEGKPVDPDAKPSCEPSALRLRFDLERDVFLLGEPILARLTVSLEGDGSWSETLGGSYRARGRDDHLLFLMRRADGTWLRDTYGKIVAYRGGLATQREVTKGKPFSLWAAVQRWCPIEQPGHYELHAFYQAHGYEVLGAPKGGGGLKWGRTAPSPLVGAIPDDVKARVKENHWGLESLACYAKIPIVIRPGRPDARARMVRDVAETDAVKRRTASMGSRGAALVAAVTFARQDDFLDVVDTWYRGEDVSYTTAAQGLAMRPSEAAFSRIVAGGKERMQSALWTTCEQQMPRFVPHLLDWLQGDDEDSKKVALRTLRRWSRDDAPKSDDVDAWRAWWKKNKRAFERRR